MFHAEFSSHSGLSNIVSVQDGDTEVQELLRSCSAAHHQACRRLARKGACGTYRRCCPSQQTCNIQHQRWKGTNVPGVLPALMLSVASSFWRPAVVEGGKVPFWVWH